MLWDLATDYYLHHADPRDWSAAKQTSYINWYTPSHLHDRKIPPLVPLRGPIVSLPVEFFDDYWLEYYRPATLSSFPKMFAYKMNSTIKYIPLKLTQDGRYGLSPFRVRTTDGDAETDKRKAKRETAHASPSDSAAASQGR